MFFLFICYLLLVSCYFVYNIFMQINSRPMFLFFFLLALLTFLIGFRFGRQVEKMDKTYIPRPTINILPTNTPIPTESPLQFVNYQNKVCGFSFVYPKASAEDKMSSESSKLTSSDGSIFYECSKTAVFNKKDALSELDVSEKINVNNQKINLYQKDKQTKMFVILNPQINRTIFFEVSVNLTDLIFKTLDFL